MVSPARSANSAISTPRDITYARVQSGPLRGEPSATAEFMDYRRAVVLGARRRSTRSSSGTTPTRRFYLVCYVRDGERVFETYWTAGRGAEAMDNNYVAHGT